MKRPTATRTDEPTVAPARYSGRSGWTSARSRAAPRTMSTAGRTIVHTIVAYPTTRLESQRLHTRSVVVHPAIHATPSPRANARASGHAEDHRSSGVSALTPIRLVEADEVTSRAVEVVEVVKVIEGTSLRLPRHPRRPRPPLPLKPRPRKLHISILPGGLELRAR